MSVRNSFLGLIISNYRSVSSNYRYMEMLRVQIINFNPAKRIYLNHRCSYICSNRVFLFLWYSVKMESEFVNECIYDIFQGSGEYKCEISVEAPTFYTQNSSSNLTVVGRFY